MGGAGGPAPRSIYFVHRLGWVPQISEISVLFVRSCMRISTIWVPQMGAELRRIYVSRKITEKSWYGRADHNSGL